MTAWMKKSRRWTPYPQKNLWSAYPPSNPRVEVSYLHPTFLVICVRSQLLHIHPFLSFQCAFCVLGPHPTSSWLSILHINKYMNIRLCAARVYLPRCLFLNTQSKRRLVFYTFFLYLRCYLTLTKSSLDIPHQVENDFTDLSSNRSVTRIISE